MMGPLHLGQPVAPLPRSRKAATSVALGTLTAVALVSLMFSPSGWLTLLALMVALVSGATAMTMAGSLSANGVWLPSPFAERPRWGGPRQHAAGCSRVVVFVYRSGSGNNCPHDFEPVPIRGTRTAPMCTSRRAGGQEPAGRDEKLWRGQPGHVFDDTNGLHVQF
jgi:hypothetical protein